MKRRSKARSAALTPSVPIPPPELLARARKLGALNAGPAMIPGAGGAMFAASAALTDEASLPVRAARPKAKRKRTKR